MAGRARQPAQANNPAAQDAVSAPQQRRSQECYGPLALSRSGEQDGRALILYVHAGQSLEDDGAR